MNSSLRTARTDLLSTHPDLARRHEPLAVAWAALGINPCPQVQERLEKMEARARDQGRR